VPASHPAVGPIADLDPSLQAAFADTSHFAPLPDPGPHDWLANHPERGQTARQFYVSRPNIPNENRHTIYVLPIGAFPEGSPSLADLEAYGEAFFTLDVEPLPPVAVEDLEVTTRTGEFGRQLRTPDLLVELRRRIPDDAYCLIGVTMEDLYPEASWNYVFGYASLDQRVGVYSFARYDPAFYGEPRGPGAEKRILRRSLKVMAHETGHMFGIEHCVHYSCTMNGSNHLAEADSRPMHLCPVCLRKLHTSVGFDPADRYRRLAAFYRSRGLDDEATWIESRLAHLASVTQAR